MCLRISSLLLAAAGVAACGAGDSPPPPGEAVECAIGTGADVLPVCTLERAGDAIILHHPDGGFRRLARDPATGTFAAFDGAEPLVPEAGGEGRVAFAIGADRYRIPASLLDPPGAP